MTSLVSSLSFVSTVEFFSASSRDFSVGNELYIQVDVASATRSPMLSERENSKSTQSREKHADQARRSRTILPSKRLRKMRVCSPSLLGCLRSCMPSRSALRLLVIRMGSSFGAFLSLRIIRHFVGWRKFRFNVHRWSLSLTARCGLRLNRRRSYSLRQRRSR